MSLPVDEIFETARSLSAIERVELAQQLVLTIEDANEEAQLAGLRAAVGVALDSLDRGEGVRVPVGETRRFVREIGDRASRLTTPPVV